MFLFTFTDGWFLSCKALLCNYCYIGHATIGATFGWRQWRGSESPVMIDIKGTVGSSPEWANNHPPLRSQFSVDNVFQQLTLTMWRISVQKDDWNGTAVHQSNSDAFFRLLWQLEVFSLPSVYLFIWLFFFFFGGVRGADARFINKK